MSQYVHFYLAGDLSSDVFGISFCLEIGAYTLNLISMTTYAIGRNVAKLTEDMYDKCEVCNGDLYAYGPPEIVNNHYVCRSCVQTINDVKIGQKDSSN